MAAELGPGGGAAGAAIFPLIFLLFFMYVANENASK